GAEAVAKADPDGYTLLAAPPPPLVINQNLYPRLGYDPAEFTPIVIMGRVPNALVVNAKLPFASVADVIAYAKANPGKLTAATQGNGITSHLTSELFQLMAGVKFQQVPYRGSAPALTDLAAGNVDLMFDNLGVSLALVKGGQLKLLGVATPKRMTALPDVPTIAETLPGFESAAWFAIVGPPKTPPAVVDKINAGVNEALREHDVRERLAQLSAEAIGGTPQAMAAYMREEVERWAKVIKAANVKLDWRERANGFRIDDRVTNARTSRRETPPVIGMTGSRIEDYGLIGDCETAALVCKDGSIDWLCWPRFDSDACFAALLGNTRNGRWRIAPGEANPRITRRYRPDTLILETTFATAEGEAVLIDFMPLRGQASHLVRLVMGKR